MARGEPLEERAGAARVVDVDVRDDEMREVVGSDPELLERGEDDRSVGARARLDRAGSSDAMRYTAFSSRSPAMPVSIAVMPGATSVRIG